MAKPAPLAAALAAARKQKWDAVLTALLQVWAAKRPPELAALIEAVSAHLPPLSLLTELESGLKAVEIAKRLKALGQLPPDPRVSTHYMKMFAAPPFTAGSSRKMWMDILNQLLTTHLDPRTPQRMRDLEPEYLSIFGATVMGKSMKFQLMAHAKKIDAALARLEKATDADLEAVADILAQLPKVAPAPLVAETPDDHAYFWKRIADDPSDPSRRIEYRDWLRSHNDPRAEFIAIQELKAIHGKLPPAEKAREQKLFEQHHSEWLGPIAPLATYPVFENGYLVACSLKPKGTLTGKVAGHPLWATVREMNVGYNKAQGHLVVLHPVMKSLKRLTSVNGSLFEQLLRPDAPPRPIEQIETWSDYNQLIPAGQDAPGLPGLKWLSLEYDGNDDIEPMLPFWTAPLVSRLEKLIIHGWHVDWAEWKQFLAKSMPASVRAEIDIDDFIFRRSPEGPYSSVEVSLQIDEYGNLYDQNSKTDMMKRLGKETWSEIVIRKPAHTQAKTWQAVEKLFAKQNYKVI